MLSSPSTKHAAAQVEANLGDIDQLSLSMEILRTVGLGKAVSKLAKLPQAHPAFAECQRIALKARSVMQAAWTQILH